MRAAVPVSVGSRFHYDGEIVTIVELFPGRRGSEVLVADRAGTRRYLVSLRELLANGRADMILDGDCPYADDPCEIASVVLSKLDETERRTLSERADHVREVLTGYQSGSEELALPGEPRPQYADGKSLEDRYAAKSIEIGVSDRTIKRWVSNYRNHGEAGLADRHLGDPFGAADPRWVRCAAEIMIEHTGLSKPSQLSVIRQANARIAVIYGEGAVTNPSRSSAYRVLSILERQVPTFRLSAKRNRDIAGQPAGLAEPWRANRPGEFLVMDSTRLDVFALDPVTLKWVSVELTVAMDAFTRCVTGLRLTPTTKGADVAAVLYQVFRPPPAPPEWPQSAVWPEHGVPRTVEPDVQYLAGDSTGLCHPAMVPETLIIDHGKAFRSQHVSSVCARLGISIQPARLRTGRDKGIVERFFRTLREDLLQILPGYKGPDVYSRGENPEREAFFFIDELEAMIRRWIAEVYHNRPHSGLVHPSVSGLRISPAEMYELGIARAGFIEAPCDPDLAFEFLRPAYRQILHYGVQYHSRRYDGRVLDEFRNAQSGHGGIARGRWPIHINPDDVTQVYFRHPTTHRWHCLRWTQAPAIPGPFDEDAVTFARRLAAANRRSTDPAAALTTMTREWNIALDQSVAGRRIALRISRERATLFGALKTAEDSAEPERTFDDDDEMHNETWAPEAPDQRDDLDQLADPDGESTDDFYADAYADTTDD
jgi:transposase InsO family protein